MNFLGETGNGRGATKNGKRLKQPEGFIGLTRHINA
jgi:hypothetical protein